MRSVNLNDGQHIQTTANGFSSASQGVPTVDITEGGSETHNATNASTVIPQGIPAVDMTEGTPGTISPDAQQYFADAVFAAINGNVEFLELLLGPTREELEKIDDEISVLNKNCIPLKAARDAINKEAFAKCDALSKLTEKMLPEIQDIDIEDIEFLKAYISMSEEFAISDGIRTRMVDAYRKLDKPQRERIKAHDRAYRARFLNGQEEKLDPTSRQERLEEYDEYLMKRELAYFASEKVQKDLQENKQKLIDLVAEAKTIVEKLEVANDAVERNGYEIETIKDAEAYRRDKKVAHVIDEMTSNPGGMPMPQRYTHLLNQNENKELRKLLVCASGAKVNVMHEDHQGHGLLYYALEKKDANPKIAELLFSRGALSTLFKKNDRENQPYNFIVIHGHNHIQCLIDAYSLQRALLGPNPTEFITRMVVEKHKRVERVLMMSYEKDIANYVTNILPLLAGYRYSAELIEQHAKFITTLRDVILPIAIMANSICIYEDAIKQMIAVSDLHVRWYTPQAGTELKNLLLKHAHGSAKAVSGLSSWRMLHQMSFLLERQQDPSTFEASRAIAAENLVLKADLVAANARADLERTEKESNRMAYERREAELLSENQNLASRINVMSTENAQHLATNAELERNREYLMNEHRQKFESLESKYAKLLEQQRRDKETIEHLELKEIQRDQIIGVLTNTIESFGKRLEVFEKQEHKPQDNTGGALRSPRSTPGYDALQDGERVNDNPHSRPGPGSV